MYKAIYGYSITMVGALKIATFNILANKFSKNVETDQKNLHWENRIIFLKTKIEELSPDILGLQEVDYPSRIIDAFLQFDYDYYFPYSKSGNNVCNMFFIKKSLKAIYNTVSITPENYPNEGFTKIIIATIIHNNSPLQIINVHFKARYSCSNVRVAQYHAIKQYITNNTIILGDFNALPHDDLIKELQLDNFISVYPLDANLLTFYSQLTKNTTITKGMFDYIFFNNHFLQFKELIELPKCLPNILPDLIYSSSDHLMLLCGLF